MWTVYLLKCKDNSLYIGITNNLDKRLTTHNKGKGSKYTRGRLPVVLLYSFEVETKSQALVFEYKIKQLSKKNKLLFFSNKLYYINNKDTIINNSKLNYQLNKDEVKLYKQSYYKKNKEKILLKKKKYRELNKEKIKISSRIYEKNKIKNDINFRLKKKISASIRKKIKKAGVSVVQGLSYSMTDLKIHIETQFESWMNWNNQGVYNKTTWDDNDQSTWKWQIDHIIPHSTFNYSSMEDQSFKECWALNNLRPYSAKQNLLDGLNKVRHDIYSKS